MKAVRKLSTGYGNVDLCDIPGPDCGPSQVVIKVMAGGVCGTDIHIFHGGYSFNPPVTLGHEFSGEVVEKGKHVDRAKIGDRVTVNPSAMGACGKCRYCQKGHYFMCAKRSSVGSKTDGGFAEYCVVEQDLIYRLPHNVPWEAGALCEPLACCVQAVTELTQVSPLDTVLISGPGPIGLICLTLVKLTGAKTIVCGTSEDKERLKFAEKFGADVTVTVNSQNLREITLDITDGYGADVALECAGVGPSVNQCLDCLAPEGRYTQIGVIDEPVEVDFGLITYKQLKVQGTIGQMWSTWEKTIKMLSEGTIDMNRFITAGVPLEDWEKAFKNTEEKKGLKSVLCP